MKKERADMAMGDLGRVIHAGVIGLGMRGLPQMKVLLQMQDVCVDMVCDLYEDRVQAGVEAVRQIAGNDAAGTLNYREVLASREIEAVFIFTSWESHIPICIEAMQAGKRPALEVGGATSVDECWEMVRVSEKTGIPVMLLENCCYNEEEMAVLNMVRSGLFGTIVHCAGAYAHDLRDEVGNGDLLRHYRQRHFLHRNGELYPTHELGPLAKYLNINRGNRMVSLSSFASKAAGLHEWLAQHRPDIPLASAQVNQGDIVTTIITCANGETIQLQHDCTLPRSYSRRNEVRGTKGFYQEDGAMMYVEGRTPHVEGDWTHRAEPAKPYLAEYQHDLWKEYREFGLRGGHGGMDYLVLRAFVESVQRREAPPIDTYDTAAWMAVTALSEESIAKGGAPVAFPDFTSGRWLQARDEKPSGIYALDP